jgi:hypothetical protein
MIGAESAQRGRAVIIDIADMVDFGRPAVTTSGLCLIFCKAAPSAERIALQNEYAYSRPIRR